MTASDPQVSRFVERFAGVFTEAGVPRMPARIFASLLVAEDSRRTASELAEALQISPAAVSVAVRYLTGVGLVMREREPGRRSDHYRVTSDVWYEAIASRDLLLSRWEDELVEGVRLLGLDSRAGARLDETRQFFAFMRSELPGLLFRWRQTRTPEVTPLMDQDPPTS